MLAYKFPFLSFIGKRLLKVFEDILKQIHLSEGVFELNKPKNMENAKSTLANNYISIYSEYKISAIDFKNTLNYYDWSYF